MGQGGPPRHPGPALQQPQRHGAREGALRGSPRRGGGGDIEQDRCRRPQADRGRLRGAALGHRRRRGPAARCAHPARAHAQRRRQAGPGNHLQHRRHARAQARRLRCRLRRCRRHRRAPLQDQARASGLHRAARLRRRRQGRTGHDLEQQPGPLHGARHDGPAYRREAERRARDPRRDRRRLRRQDHRLPRAAGADPRAQVRPSGQDGDEPAGGVPRHGADLGIVDDGQGGCHQGRQDHCAEVDDAAAGRRVPRLADPRRRWLLGCALRSRQRAHDRPRHRHQPAQGGRLPGARRADRRVRRRVGARRPGPGSEDGPAGAAPEERRQAGHQSAYGPTFPASATSRRWRPRSAIPTTRRPSSPTRVAASPAASGSTPAANRARRSTSTRTAPSSS